jgi:gluconate 2-dehydrogenase gamma chain
MLEHVSRREWLKQATLAGVSIVALPELGRVLAIRRALAAGESLGAQSQTLSVTELATLDAACARLVPTDDLGPGAKEAQAAIYIDRALKGALASSREDYARGLADLDSRAQAKSAKPFAQLPATDQDAVLTEIERTPFFAMLRSHTLQGMFCDPIYGGNANFVGWDLIAYPGVRLSVAANEQNMSTPAKPNHKSAYDYVMFSKTGVM